MEKELAQRVDIALSQSKALERDARALKQQLAGIRDLLQLNAQGADDGTEAEEVGR